MKTKGLSLAEAHASGRKYRRNEWIPGYRRCETFAEFISFRDALATDYELEPEAKPLTRDDVSMAIHAALRGTVGTVNLDHYLAQNVIDRLFGLEGDV
jgi:hypothetical protein